MDHPSGTAWDHSTDERFYNYYAEASQSQRARERFRSIRDCVLRVLDRHGGTGKALDVADIGCGAGTQSLLWAELGHRVHALDVNEPLLNLARERSVQAGHVIDYRLGSATDLPWADESMDVCLLVELLEHVTEWRVCLRECARVLRPGGILFLTTSNKLCPRQQEFNLPLYSWYPKTLKRRFEKLAATTRPEIVNYAKYPAVNWFTFYSLRAALAQYGLVSMDRFDIMDLRGRPAWTRAVIRCVRAMPVLRWLGHVATPGTLALAVRLSDKRGL
ncbi:MAG TPA: class I SAM-dependent methyltransferase [Candidatus Binatia bacterium]|nr:class I SAM-dependent methyltransferase [Candidatus Binatia bacterium]